MRDRSLLRILAVAERTHGLNGASYVSAFRRQGHSVLVVDEAEFLAPGLQNRALRALRRLATPMLVRDFNDRLQREIATFQPDLLFVYKGAAVSAESVEAARAAGAVTINYYPDTGYASHSALLPEALKRYDWCYTAKSFGPHELLHTLGIANCSYLPHCFDPEVHRPVALTETDQRRYMADLSFVGSWSWKKQDFATAVTSRLPELTFRIWGGGGWFRVADQLPGAETGGHLLALEYAKACAGTAINLGWLYEGAEDSSSPDKSTARTFELAGMGVFMLHERTEEVLDLFEEDREIACFDGVDEMIDKIRFFHARPQLRREIAAACRARAVASGYSIDDRVNAVLDRVEALR